MRFFKGVTMDDQKLFKSRMTELSARAESGGYYTFSQFLTVSEQAELSALFSSREIGRYTLIGGFEGAERKYAAFGDAELFGYKPTPESLWLALTPRDQKFADTLTHRDVLGSLMALGIKRELFGDILLVDNVAYLYALESITPYISEHLTRIKHTDVTVSVVDAPPDTALTLPDATAVTVASERLDALLAAVFKLSREKAKTAIERELCAINGRVTTKPDTVLKAGETVSLRGSGRFLFDGFLAETKKGKLRVAVRIFR